MLDLLILMEFVLNVLMDLLLVHQLIMELLVYLDTIYKLNGQIVQNVHLQLLPVLHLLISNNVYLVIMLPQLLDLMFLVMLVQQLEMLLNVIMQLMLQDVNQNIIQIMDNV